MSRRFRRRSGCLAVVAVLATLLALVQLLTACGGVSEPETTVETVEVEKVVTVIVVPEPTEAPAEEALEPTEAEPMPEPTDELPEATEAAQEPEATEPPQPTPISPGAVVQKELERLAAGRIAYNPPTEMTVDKTERVEVRISMDMAAPLAEGLKGLGEPVVEPIQVSCFMKVRLVSEDFHIVAFSSEEQIVPAEGFTEWAWDVTPTKSGTRSLSLIVTALVKASEAEGEKDLPIIEREIQVKVNPGYMVSSFFVANRGWIFTAVLLPVVAALGRWLWRRQQRNKEVGDPEAGGEAGEA